MEECFTRDRGVAGLSLTGGTVLCPEQDTLSSALYWFNPGRTIPTRLKNVDWEKQKIIIFLSISLNMCFGTSKEPSHTDCSFECPQHMF